MPEPSNERLFWPSIAVEPLEQPRQFGLRNADAGVADDQLGAVAGPRELSSSTAIPPSKVNLKALERRLRTIFSHMSRST